MEAAEIGVTIRVDAVIDLASATLIELRVQGPSESTLRALAMTVSTPTNFATRKTLATDFPESGNFFMQLRATFPDGRDLLSPMILEHVTDSLILGLC